MAANNKPSKIGAAICSVLRMPLVWLFIIFFIGLFFRLFRFADFMAVDGDHARDILIAKHIIEYGEGFWTAPYAFGAGGTVYNSPVFYWILAGMWLVSGSALGMGMVFAMSSALVIGLAYGAGKLFGGTRAGFMFALYFSISSLLVGDARGVCQTCFIPAFVVPSLFCMAWLTRERSHLSMIFFITSIFLGIHIHQSFLPFFGAGLVWSAWRYIRNQKTAVFFFTFTLMHIVFWAMVTGNGLDTARRYFDLITFGEGTFSFSAFLYRAWQSVYILIPQFHKSVSYVYLVAMLVSLPMLLRIRAGKERLPEIVALFAVIFLYGVYRHEDGALLPAHYLKIASVLFLFILSYSSAVLIRSKTILVSVICVTGILLSTGNLQYFQPYSGGNYKDHRQITVQILGDNLKVTGRKDGVGVAFYAHYFSDPIDSWRYVGNASPQWYFLEEIYNEQAVTIARGANSFSPPPLLPDTAIYLICVNNSGNLWDDEASYQAKCTSPFISLFSQELDNRRMSQLHPHYGQNGHIYQIFRYKH